jgi:hypothetical protein
MEFAAVAPFFILLVVGTYDIVQFLRLQLRLETVAVQIGQIVSQCTSVTDPGDTAQFWAHGQEIAGDMADLRGSRGAIILSAVFNDNGANRVAWQVRTGGAGFRSAIGNRGGPATFPDDLLVPAGQTMIATEVFATAQPWVLSANLLGALVPTTLHGSSMLLSRAPNAARVQQSPTTSNAMACTA